MSVPLLRNYFSNNDFLGVRVRVVVHKGTKGKRGSYGRSKVLEKWSWRSGVQSYYHMT